MEITPSPPEKGQVVESYGAGRFRVSGELYEGSILVAPEATRPWQAERVEDVTIQSLEPLFEMTSGFDILILGCGPNLAMVAPSLRQALRERGVVLEPMDTGAACRTSSARNCSRNCKRRRRATDSPHSSSVSSAPGR